MCQLGSGCYDDMPRHIAIAPRVLAFVEPHLQSRLFNHYSITNSPAPEPHEVKNHKYFPSSTLTYIRNRNSLYNTIGSSDDPNFRNQQTDLATPEPARPRFKDYTQDIAHLWSNSTTPVSNQKKTLSEIGDSSSLFASNDSPDSGVAGRTVYTIDSSPITYPSSQHSINVNTNNMVNERSSAKVPVLPLAPKSQPTKYDGATVDYASRPPPSAVPQFGAPTMPHSPLHRPAPRPSDPKDSILFNTNKSRPEHHRDGRPGM